MAGNPRPSIAPCVSLQNQSRCCVGASCAPACGLSVPQLCGPGPEGRGLQSLEEGALGCSVDQLSAPPPRNISGTRRLSENQANVSGQVAVRTEQSPELF